MSVFMMLQVGGDPSRLAEVMSNTGRWESINARAKENGAIHLRFFASSDGGSIGVVDERESENGFRALFESGPEIPPIVQEAGATSEPRITFWHPHDTPDRF